MNNLQLEALVSCIGVKVVSLDKLPTKRLTSDAMFIYNVDPHPQPGLHWCAVCVFFDPNNMQQTQVIHFDGLGIPPVLPRVVQFVNSNYTGNLAVNNFPLQKADDTCCGELTVIFAHWLKRGRSYASFLKEYDAIESNAQRVRHLFGPLRGALDPLGAPDGGGGDGATLPARGGVQVCRAMSAAIAAIGTTRAAAPRL